MCYIRRYYYMTRLGKNSYITIFPLYIYLLYPPSTFKLFITQKEKKKGVKNFHSLKKNNENFSSTSHFFFNTNSRVCLNIKIEHYFPFISSIWDNMGIKFW